MDPCVRQVGWDNWGKVENERSACFYEYRYFIHVKFHSVMFYDSHHYEWRLYSDKNLKSLFLNAQCSTVILIMLEIFMN